MNLRPSSLRLAALATLALAAAGCLRLDMFLFNGSAAPMDADLLERAELIPVELREEFFLDAEDGTKVNAWLARHRPGEGVGRAVLYCHGNKRNIDEYALRVQELWKLGYEVLVFDYRGYGKTPGKTTEAGAYQDGRAARAFLETRFPPEHVALYGFSLGAAVCTRLAADSAAPALVLEAPFASVKSMANGSVGLEAPGAWFADSVMDNVATIPAHRGDLLVMHGTRDDFVKPEYGAEIERVARATARSTRLWLVEGARHSTVPCNDHLGEAPVSGCAGGFSDAWRGELTGVLDRALGVER